MGNKSYFIINPAGCGGRTPGRWQQFKQMLATPPGDDAIAFTNGPGHARELARAAAAGGKYDTIVSVGGDGTAGEVASGMLDRAHAGPGAGRQTMPRLALVPAGAGNDACRAVGIMNMDDALAALTGNRVRGMDVIKVDYRADEKPATRYALMFANISFGVAKLASPRLKRIIGGRATYNVAIVRRLLGYRPPVFNITSDGFSINEPKWTVLLANIATGGGGAVMVAPGVECDDGRMMMTVVPVRPKLAMITRVLPLVAAGRHVDEADFDYLQVRSAVVECAPAAEIEIDGDFAGFTPGVFTHMPGAISVLAP